MISLSSAESELNASIRAGQEALGVVHFSSEMGKPHTAQVLGDSSAAQGINMRVGCGRAKHLSIRRSRLQEKVSKGELEVMKIPREENCSDAMTHHWSHKDGLKHFSAMHSERRVHTEDCWTRGGVKAECRGEV